MLGQLVRQFPEKRQPELHEVQEVPEVHVWQLDKQAAQLRVV